MLWISLTLAISSTQHCVYFLHSHKENQKLDTSDIPWTATNMQTLAEDAFQKQSLNMEGTIV